MDWQIRIALIIIGLGVIGFIVYDFNRRKKAQAEKERLIDQMRRSAEHVDASGFDFTGVGSARPAGNQAHEPEANLESQQTEPSAEQKPSAKQSKPSAVNAEPVEPVIAETEIPQSPPQQTTEPSQEPRQSPTEQMSLDTAPSEEPELVFSLILQAEAGQTFKGKDFMPLVLSQGLRHGEMGIFHRHMGAGGKPGPVMYSVANAIKPGTFELTNIESFETPAFAFFMTVPGPQDPIAAFEGMVKTIELFKQELGGQILDETKSVYTQQTRQHQFDTLQTYLTKASLNQS